jgi:hypothetical protein
MLHTHCSHPRAGISLTTHNDTDFTAAIIPPPAGNLTYTCAQAFNILELIRERAVDEFQSSNSETVRLARSRQRAVMSAVLPAPSIIRNLMNAKEICKLCGHRGLDEA